MVLGVCVVLCKTEPDFMKIIFLFAKWGKYSTPRVFECIRNFTHYFFSIWSIIKDYINCCKLR